MSAIADDDLAAHRRRAVGLAYRLLGTVADAEDVAQEAVLRLHRADPPPDVPDAWLARVVTRLCLDRLRSARARREVYVGPWLPEPWVTGADPADEVAMAESLSLALLVVLERLSPGERAAFVLHDAFGYDYDGLAGILDRSPAACRQLVSRARRALAEERPRYEPAPARRDAVAAAFLEAAAEGDVDRLVAVLAEDVVLRADAGGRRPAPRSEVVGAEKVAKVIDFFGRRKEGEVRVEPRRVNGTLGALVLIDGEPDTLVGVDVADDRVIAVHLVREPGKVAAALARRG